MWNADPGSSGTLPGEFVRRMGEMLGPELDRFLDALSAPERGLRANGLRIEPERLPGRLPFRLERLAFPPEGYVVVDVDSRPGKHPYHAAGVYYLQDPGSMAVGALADPRPGERVLDLSAAPGGKATHLAARMENRGLLVANEVDAVRARELVGNVERCGVRNAIVTVEGAERLGAHFGAYFDLVLVDAPCSGESMFHKSAAAREGWSPAAVAGCARRQSNLLRSAAELVRPGGRLVYSTCTFSREENEEVVGAFLESEREFVPGALAALPGGEGAALSDSSAAAEPPAAYRLWPHRMAGAGHFVAELRRTSGPAARARPEHRAPVPRAAKLLEDAIGRGGALGGTLDPALVRARGDRLYAVPEGTPDLGGLRVSRAGVELGSVRANRFEPAHALAMSAAPGVGFPTLVLPVADPRVERFLAGHPLRADGPPGWTVVCVDGFPLGWGKRVGDVVKNHYPKGLRRRETPREQG